MGVMGTPTFNPAQPTIAPPPPSAPPPPPPPPAPVKEYRETKKGKKIPIGEFGNRLDTAAGAKKEAEMAAAAHALKVAHSEAVHGRIDNAEKARAKALEHTNAANVKPAGAFEKAVTRDYTNIGKIIDEKRKPAPSAQPEDTGGDETPISQPTISRSTAPTTTPSAPKPKIVKNPNRDVVDLSRDEFSVSSVSRLLFEQVGSIELVNISRRDTIEGQNPYYAMISNLSSIRKNFDPTSIITRQKSNQNIYSNYTIRLNDKIPDDNYLERNNLTDFYYIDDNGDLVIELDNLANDEIIDFEIASSGTINLVDEA